jgi:CRP-like cAMP-binding protein
MQLGAEIRTTGKQPPRSAGLVRALDPHGTNTLILRDRTLFAEGDEAAYVYRILSGVVRTYKLMPDGRRHVIDFMMAGDLLGIEPGERHVVAAEAVSDCVVCRYPRRQVDLATDDDPGLARELLALTCSRLAAAHSHLMALGRKTAEERLASFLLNLADDTGRAVPLPMGRVDIADHLGLTVETVSRLFAGLRKARLIDFDGAHSFVVLDRAALHGRSAASLAD